MPHEFHINGFNLGDKPVQISKMLGFIHEHKQVPIFINLDQVLVLPNEKPQLLARVYIVPLDVSEVTHTIYHPFANLNNRSSSSMAKSASLPMKPTTKTTSMKYLS